MNRIEITNSHFNDGWSFHIQQSFIKYIQAYIQTEQNQLDEIICFCLKSPEFDCNFRWSVELGTIQFTVGVFPQEKVIRIGSKNLSKELLIIDSLGEEKLDSLNDLIDFTNHIACIPLENSPSYIEFKSIVNNLPLFNEDKFTEIVSFQSGLSSVLVKEINKYRQNLFEKMSDIALDLTANFKLVRVHLLKFLAILPCLDHDISGNEVKRIFLESINRLIMDSDKALENKLKAQNRAIPTQYRYLFQVILKISKHIPPKILSYIIKKKTSIIAKRFIAGESIELASRQLQSLLLTNRDATIDQLGELVVSAKEADIYTQKVIDIIQGLNRYIKKGSKNKANINKAHVSIKVTALTHSFIPQDFDFTYSCIAPRLLKILLAAKEHEVFINIDAEHYHYRDCVLEVYGKVLLDNEELKDFDQTGIVLQAYLKDSLIHYNEILELAKKRNLLMPIRLVKGAYWDAETIEATAHNYEAPQYLNKEETDLNFRQLIFKMLEDSKYIQLAIASHNIQDHCFGEVLREELFKDAPVIEHQCLHMTYEGLSTGMAKLGWATRNYIPVGDLIVGMAYLVRRIMENSSQVGVLTIMRSHKKSLDNKTPYESLLLSKLKNTWIYEESISSINREFKNIYPVRTYLKRHFDILDKEVKNHFQEISKNQKEKIDSKMNIYCSSYPEILLANITKDTPETVEQKIEELFQGFLKKYHENPIYERTLKLVALSDLLLVNREKLIAIIIYEAGKTLDEAVADVDEAIDFINFYIREQINLERKSFCKPKGVVGVIAPWNFPLAIPCGMTVAGLCAGNHVLLKPAEQTPIIAQEFINLCYEAGFEKSEVQIAFGEGEVGKAIVANDLINGVVFTGSKEVGTSIYKQVSDQLSNERYPFETIPKFAITEMGGKNAIIVTNNCEMDETISGILYAAFAHAGQKCSACSRILIDQEIRDNFVARFTSAVNDLQVGRSDNYSTVVNPLITKEDQGRVKKAAITSEQEVKTYGGVTIIDLSKKTYPGFCVGPSVFELPTKTVLENTTFATKEVFGPVIHLVTYKDLDEAVEIFNSTDYALTGGIFCQSQNDIDYLVPRLNAGNIYINRPNTGARVAIEPFGGFKLSGTGPKAGSANYLTLFSKMSQRHLNRNNPHYDCDESAENFVAFDSKLSMDRRIYNSKRLIESMINQFEVIFGEVFELEKNKLIALRDSINDGAFELQDIEFPNREIPGQISFNKKDITLGAGCIIDTDENLNIELIMDFLTNLIIGNGISILTTNSIIYNKWKRIEGLAFSNGFSTFNLSLSIFSKEDLLKYLEENKFKFAVFSSINIDQVIKTTLIKNNSDDSLIKLFYCGQHEDLEESIDRFTNTRSFAINTMRHGAALDMSVQEYEPSIQLSYRHK